MKNYWCCSCDNRWFAYEKINCPRCKSDEVRPTMPPEEADRLGLKNNE